MALSDTITALGTAIINLVNTREKSSNKTTSITSSSTDTQYPSAKSVYTALQNVGASIPITYDV